MYKIIKKDKSINGESYWSFYEENCKKYISDNIEDAISKYKELLNYFSVKEIKLINDVELELEVEIKKMEDDSASNEDSFSEEA